MLYIYSWITCFVVANLFVLPTVIFVAASKSLPETVIGPDQPPQHCHKRRAT